MPVIIAGSESMDMGCALEALQGQFGVKSIRVDSGGFLTGVVLRLGLMEEVSVLFNSELVGGESPRSMFAAPDLTSAAGMIGLRLVHLERVQDDLVWARYEVLRAGASSLNRS